MKSFLLQGSMLCTSSTKSDPTIQPFPVVGEATGLVFVQWITLHFFVISFLSSGLDSVNLIPVVQHLRQTTALELVWGSRPLQTFFI
jgi:hypothetical protein